MYICIRIYIANIIINYEFREKNKTKKIFDHLIIFNKINQSSLFIQSIH